MNHQPQRTKVIAAITAPLLKRKRTLCEKASGKLFPKEKYSREVRWLFAALAGFMPQAIFMGTYVNTDSLALLAAAMILYAWASYLREDWTWKNCILLAVGMAVCALSYYNAYGWILCSFFFFCFRFWK